MAKPDYFASRCKGGLARRRKIVGRRHCRVGPIVGSSLLRRPRRGPLPMVGIRMPVAKSDPAITPPIAALLPEPGSG